MDRAPEVVAGGVAVAKGLVVDWVRLYGATKPSRISLPTYPFDLKRYWVPVQNSSACPARDAGQAPRESSAATPSGRRNGSNGRNRGRRVVRHPPRLSPQAGGDRFCDVGAGEGRRWRVVENSLAGLRL